MIIEQLHRQLKEAKEINESQYKELEDRRVKDNVREFVVKPNLLSKTKEDKSKPELVKKEKSLSERVN